MVAWHPWSHSASLPGTYRRIKEKRRNQQEENVRRKMREREQRLAV